MTRELTQKQEIFVQGLFKGMSQREAYVVAGYSSKQLPATIDRHACELANSGKIKTRWDELNQKAEDESVAKVLERKQRLTEILRARLTDYVTCGPDRDLIDVGPGSPNTGALQEITSRTEYSEDGAGVAVITKIKLHGPTQAIDLLNKMDHIYGPDGQLRDVNIVFVIGKGYSDLPQLIEGEDGNSD